MGSEAADRRLAVTLAGVSTLRVAREAAGINGARCCESAVRGSDRMESGDIAAAPDLIVQLKARGLAS